MNVPFKGQTIEISGCEYSHVHQFVGRATKEGVTMKPAQAPITWCCARFEGRIVAFGGLMPTGKGGVRLRSRWVHPDFRGHGLGGALNAYRIKAAAEAGYSSVDGFARKASGAPKWFFEHGFAQVGETAVAIHVRRAL